MTTTRPRRIPQSPRTCELTFNSDDGLGVEVHSDDGLCAEVDSDDGLEAS